MKIHATLQDWLRDEAIPFPADSAEAVHSALDQVIASLGGSVELLGFGEALHGGEDILILRNRVFQRLVEAHGYRAIAMESSFPRSRVVNEFIHGRGPASYQDVQETGFSHGFGRLAANRELAEWMRSYNADPSHRVKLRFYGFDLPALQGGIASPSQMLRLVLDYLTSIDSASGREHRRRIDSLLGPDSDWENPAAMADPTKSVGLSPAANALRLATEDLITELRIRRPELVAGSDSDRYAEALHDAAVARELLNFHAASAQPSEGLYARLLGIRDALMADNLESIMNRERERGAVLAFAHNSHLQRGKAVLPWASWWPAGAHLQERLGPRYAVIGSALGVSEANGIRPPEDGSLEALLTSFTEQALFLPTHRGAGLPASDIAALPVRSGSSNNPSYLPLSSQSVRDFDWLGVLQTTAYHRGGPPLQDRSAGSP